MFDIKGFEKSDIQKVMNIKKIDSYIDGRFSKNVLNQHGAYLIDGEPYQVEITDPSSAVVYGKDPAVYKTLIEEFRFHAPHIFKFCRSIPHPHSGTKAPA